MEQERICAFELEKIRLENETEVKAEIERAIRSKLRRQKQAAKETERMRLQTEAEKLKYEAEKERRDAEANKLKLEAETVKARMENEYRMKEIEIRNRDMGAGGDAETGLKIVCSCTLFVQLKLENVQSKRNICAVHF